ncbi:hypothetical protein ACFX5K_01495 [Rickettsiales bacterium LUAb2]
MTFFKKSQYPDNDMLEVNNDKIEDNKKSLFARVFKNEEGQFYSEIITKGFVWVLMFFVSLIALILVFKDDYNSNKQVVVVNGKNDSSYMSNYNNTSTDNGFAFNNSNTDDSNNADSSNDKSLTTNSKTNQATVANNKPAVNAMQQQDSSDNNSSSSASLPVRKNDTIGNLIRSTSNTSGSASTMANNQNVDNSDSSDSKNTSDLNNSNNNKLNTNVANNSVSKNNNANIAANKPIVNAAPKTNNLSNAPKASVASVQDVWLVTIFSGASMDVAMQKWNKIEAANSGLFINKRVYFLKAAVQGKGLYYRVALGDVNSNDQYPSFNTPADASKYCAFLKSQKLDCFIVKTSKNIIMNLVNSSLKE